MTEQKLQSQCVMWFDKEFPNHRKMLHCNNNNSHDRRSGNVAKAMGVQPGVSDLELIIRGAVVFIELKTEKGVQSEDQIKFQDMILSRGHMYYIVRDLEHFKRIVCGLLSGN